MRVSALAKQLNITPDTVRYYTRIGLLSPVKNSSNGYKSYGKHEQQRLHFILSARRLGFSIEDITQILAEAATGHSACPLVRQLIEQRLKQTELQFQQTQALRARMKNALKQWQSEPDKPPTGHMVCHLIEAFNESLIEEQHYATEHNA